MVDKTLSDRLFDPERVTSYEAGIKAQLFNRRVTFNLATFHYDYSNLQLLRLVASTAATSTIVDNVAQSKVDGVETDLRWAVTRRLSLGASYSYLDGRFSDYTYAAVQDFPAVPTPFGDIGSQTANYWAPPRSCGASVAMRFWPARRRPA